MKKIIVILALTLVLTSCKEINSGGRYRFLQTYEMINGITTMRTVVVAWEKGGIVGNEIYDNTITLNVDSVVYYKEVEKMKAEAYRVQWFKINRPGIEPENVDTK
jgi:hypothetical protein